MLSSHVSWKCQSHRKNKLKVAKNGIVMNKSNSNSNFSYEVIENDQSDDDNNEQYFETVIDHNDHNYKILPNSDHHNIITDHHNIITDHHDKNKNDNKNDKNDNKNDKNDNKNDKNDNKNDKNYNNNNNKNDNTFTFDNKLPKKSVRINGVMKRSKSSPDIIATHCDDHKSVSRIPIVLVHGLFGTDKHLFNIYDYWDSCYFAKDDPIHYNVIKVSLNPYGSNYDRAIQLFHILKGDHCYFGKRCYGRHSLIDETISHKGKYEIWSEDHPVHLVGFSMGSTTCRELMYLLRERKIPKYLSKTDHNHYEDMYYETSDRWIRSIVCIAGPLCGSITTHKIMDEYRLANMILPFFGWLSSISKISQVISKFMMYERCRYWSFCKQDLICLTYDKIINTLGDDTCMNDLRVDMSMKKIDEYSCQSKITNRDHNYRVPVLKIVFKKQRENPYFVDKYKPPHCYVDEWIESDGVVSCYSQRCFYNWRTLYDQKITNLFEFTGKDHDDMYYEVEDTHHYDINLPSSKKRLELELLFFKIYNVLTKISDHI
jgi:hypothetical protein